MCDGWICKVVWIHGTVMCLGLLTGIDTQLLVLGIQHNNTVLDCVDFSCKLGNGVLRRCQIHCSMMSTQPSHIHTL